MMTKSILLAGCILAVALRADVEEKNTIQKSFAVSQPAAARLEVDNVNGSIRISGYDGREVQVIARETVSAESPEKLAQARQEVKLDAGQQGDTVRLFVDGPFRCKCADGSMNYRGWRHYGYRVTYDFEIKAPREMSVFLRTINHGEIRVADIGGNYDIENINGGIEFLEAAGAGRVYALNGGVKVTFRRNPAGESTFGSLNGEVELYFQPNLSADFRMKTFNGAIYSDFEVSPLPIRMTSAERRDGKRVYRTDKFTGARVGSGGPEIKLDGFNGDIRILKRK